MLAKLFKKIRYILLFIIIITLSSCGSSSYYDDSINHLDGVSFIEYKKIDEETTLLLPTNIASSIAYEIELGNEVSDKSIWTINYDYKYDYLTNYDHEKLYEIINNEKDYLNNYIPFQMELYNPNDVVEMEYTLNNPNLDNVKYVIVKAYLPVIINDGDTEFGASIQIKNIVVLKINDSIQAINGTLISWDDFINKPEAILN